MTRFDDDTSVTRLGPGKFEGLIDPAWRIVVGANGGHIAAMLLRGMVQTIDDPERQPATFTVHFTRSPKEAPVQVETEVERSGRSMSTLTGRMVQDEKLIAFGVGSFALPRTGPEFVDVAMPEVPPPESVEPTVDRPDFPFGHHFDYRPALGPRLPDSPQQIVDGQAFTTSDKAEIGLWLRLREPQPTDHMVVTQLMDAFAPAVFAKLGQGGGGAGVPTIEMTYHYRQRLPREDDWYLGVFRSGLAHEGFVEEDGWLWSRDGTLVAQSRQLALLM